MNSYKVAVLGLNEATQGEDLGTMKYSENIVQKTPNPQWPLGILSCRSETGGAACPRQKFSLTFFHSVAHLFTLCWVLWGKFQKSKCQSGFLREKQRGEGGHKTSSSAGRRTVEASSPWKSSRETKTMKKTTHFQWSWSSGNTHKHQIVSCPGSNFTWPASLFGMSWVRTSKYRRRSSDAGVQNIPVMPYPRKTRSLLRREYCEHRAYQWRKQREKIQKMSRGPTGRKISDRIFKTIFWKCFLPLVSGYCLPWQCCLPSQEGSQGSPAPNRAGQVEVLGLIPIGSLLQKSKHCVSGTVLSIYIH